MIKELAETAGLDGPIVSQLSGHSMRVGAAQDMMASGIGILPVMQAGGWKSTELMLQKIIRVVSWGTVVTVGVSTLVPIEYRPHTGAPGHLEQAAAYAVAATLFSFGYRHRSLMVIIALFLIYAASLEIAQHYAPGRHASILDWMAKSFGALIGVIIGGWLRPMDEKKAAADFIRP